MAQLAGVSEATVSRVLNNVGPLTENTKQKVLDAAKKLDYFPNVVAQRFAQKKSGNIGIVLPNIPNVKLFSTYYFSEILSGIGARLENSNYDLLLLFRNPQQPTDYAKWYKTGKVDALIILGSMDVTGEREALTELNEASYPYCLLNQRFEGTPCHVIDGDHKKGSFAVVNHFIHQGCKQIAFLNGPSSYSNSTDRLEGYKQALAVHGMSWRSTYYFEGNYSRTSGYQMADQILHLMPKLDAVYAANDRMAIGFMQRLKEKNIQPGQQMLVAGYDDSDSASLADPQLTSVHVPFYEMGWKAADNMFKKCSGVLAGSEPITELLPTKLIIRSSSKFNLR